MRNWRRRLACTRAMTLSDKTLGRACRKAHEGGFHVHVAEHESDEYDSLNRHAAAGR